MGMTLLSMRTPEVLDCAVNQTHSVSLAIDSIPQG